ncbi:hypothetical protein CPB83DRAFT_855271 [Crepidotus variabilis]|uniref:Secreted protein n=1 Tax=Crepidotus variabilis TaxID=179855 RepID=A0A9P6EG07_9AGAR|nr:hypothetical protein CPB83DRAFT_855271 [Crepidotus variabilis]
MKLALFSILITLSIAAITVIALPIPVGERPVTPQSDPKNNTKQPESGSLPSKQVKWVPDLKENEGNRKVWNAEQKKQQRTPERKKEKKEREKEENAYQDEQSKARKEARKKERADIHAQSLAKKNGNGAAAGEPS